MGKHKNIAAILGLFVAIISTIALATSVYATTNTESGLFMDSNDVRWEYLRKTDTENVDEPESVSIMFYDKPESMSQIIVPSLEEVLEKVPNATSTLDTYYIKNATGELHGETKRESTADITKVDFTNTSKVQILGVEPMINNDVETEIIFGDNIVIGDGEMDVWAITITDYNKPDGSYTNWNGDTTYYYGKGQSRNLKSLADSGVPNWDSMTPEERIDYIENIDYDKKAAICLAPEYVDEADRNNHTYNGKDGNIDSCQVEYQIEKAKGAFKNLKLKVSGLEKVKYIGWHAFENVEFNEANREIEIGGTIGSEPRTYGEAVFAGTNITKVTLLSDNMGTGMFMDDTDLSEIVFSDDVTTVAARMFKNTNLGGSMDFSNTNITTIGAESFMGANLNEINLGNKIEKLDYKCFMNNNIRELYMPKSLNDLNTAYIFHNNPVKKLTIAYDTQTSGTTVGILHLFDGTEETSGCGGKRGYYDETTTACNIEEITILAPYAENEEVSDKHLGMAEYTSRRAYVPMPTEMDASESDKFKNVLAPAYFYGITTPRKITIGEGYSFIGTNEFFDNANNYSAIYSVTSVGADINNDNIEKIILPESLRGIGFGAFSYINNEKFEINLPEKLEYIGNHAFRATIFMQNDVILPDLYYIGINAFTTTGVHDIYLGNKLITVGIGAFQSCWNIHDITIDFDLRKMQWSGHPGIHANFGDEQIYFKGDRCNFYGDHSAPCILKRANNGTSQKFGTITFTENAFVDDTFDGNFWFYTVNADKLDLSKAKITSLPNFQASNLGELILPEGLKEIGANAFNQAHIETPLVLPEGLETIGVSAISKRTYLDNPYIYDGICYDSCAVPEITIANIPSSLKVINDFAFANIAMLENVDVNLPNAEYIGVSAFDGTGIKSVNIPNSANIGTFAFVHTNNLESATVNTEKISNYPFSLFFGNIVCSGGPTNYYYEGDYYKYYDSWDDTYSGKVYEHNGKYYGGYEEGTSYHDGNYEKEIYYHDGKYYSQREYDWYEEEYRYIDQREYDPATGYVKYYDDLLNDYRDYVVYYDEANNEYHIREIDYDGYYNELYQNPTDQCYYESYSYGSYNYRLKNANIFQSNIKTLKIIGSFSLTTYDASFDVLDLSAATSIAANTFNSLEVRQLVLPENLETIDSDTFFRAKVSEPFALPTNLKALGAEAFQWAEVTITGDLPETLEIIDRSAFYGTDPADELTIPASVRHIGQSAFNAGDVDVHYDKFTIKPNLDYEKTADQAVFQMLWNADIDELVIESNTLPVLASTGSNPIAPTNPNMDYYRGDEEPEFWGMTMQKVSLTNIPTITKYAFESCDNLVEVDLSANTNIANIEDYAFADDNKLAKVTFADGIEDNTVNLGLMSFAGTALKDISGPDSSFDLTAAKFNADKAVFANINTLVNVSVPNNFTNGTIPELTFFNDTELRSAELDYKIEEVKNKAFAGDDKLLRVIIWGKDTNVVDKPASTLEDIDVDLDADLLDESLLDNPTIPQTTDIYAYSVSIAEDLYAEDEAREGSFYALDEVMQLSSNNVRPMLNDDETDFDKSDVILYALRRDGVILESTELYNFSDAYKRTDQSGKGGFGADDDDDAALRAQYATMILDTPVPMDEVDLSNQNFEEVTFDIESSDLIRIYYEDWYSGAIRETTLIPYSEDIDVPKTGFMNAVSTTTKIALPVCPIILVAYLIYRKKQHRE